jgi:hypothetical protein
MPTSLERGFDSAEYPKRRSNEAWGILGFFFVALFYMLLCNKQLPPSPQPLKARVVGWATIENKQFIEGVNDEWQIAFQRDGSESSESILVTPTARLKPEEWLPGGRLLLYTIQGEGTAHGGAPHYLVKCYREAEKRSPQ